MTRAAMEFTARDCRSFEGGTAILAEVRDFVLAAVDPSPLADGERRMVMLAVDEAVANVLEHGAGGDVASVEVGVAVGAGGVQVTVTDTGMTFDPRTVPDVNIVEHVNAGRRGGLGVFLMRKIMDEVDYGPDDRRRNVLRMTKYAGDAERQDGVGTEA